MYRLITNQYQFVIFHEVQSMHVIVHCIPLQSTILGFWMIIVQHGYIRHIFITKKETTDTPHKNQ
jgi:hypothetical protein